MTLEIFCYSCGESLYSGFDLKSVKDIIKLYGGECKKCGVPLSVHDFVIEVIRRPT